MTEPHDGQPRVTRARVTQTSTDKQPREATVWIGYRNETTRWEFGSELAARRYAMEGDKPKVEEHTLGKPPE